jgi:hypothetical protein
MALADFGRIATRFDRQLQGEAIKKNEKPPATYSRLWAARSARGKATLASAY